VRSARVSFLPQTTTSAYTIHDHVVRFGLNYRFN